MKRSKFNLSNYKLLSMNMGNLVPIGITEALPGDTIQHATNALIRCSPLLAPVMHPLHARIHHWFVPFRLIWDDWEDFITGGEDGMNASVFPTITFSGGGITAGTVPDYMGLPFNPGGAITTSALPFRAYNLIWNEWYRDQDLQTKAVISTASGTDSTTSTVMRNICWEKDYFTSARPWSQKGPEVTLPLGTEAPVTGIGGPNQTYVGSSGSAYETDGSASTTYASYSNQPLFVEEDPNNAGFPNIRADLSNATAATINDLREALAIQRYEEARAMYGSRYVEYLRYLGVKSSDARLQRPEYLGGGKQNIQFSEVLQTGVTTDGDDSVGVGNLKGHGISSLRSNRYRRYFEEHGFVMSFISAKPKTMYINGIQRHWNRRTKEDFFQKELQHIGQQEIENREIFGTSGTPTDTFGYQDRYDEYRKTPSTVAGEFRDSTLNYWHMARDFSSQPTLNSDFVEANPTNRIFASTSTDQLYVMASHSMQARRLLSKKATPKIY